MKTRSIVIALVLAIVIMAWGTDRVHAEGFRDYWVNPAYRNLSPQVSPLPKTARDNVPTICNSYDEFKLALKTNFENRVTSFSLRLLYNLNFSEAEINGVINQAFGEIKSEDDYLFYNIVKRTIDASGFDGDVTLTYTMTYWTTLAQEQQVSQHVTEMLAQIITSAMTDEEKTKRFMTGLFQMCSMIRSKMRFSTARMQHCFLAKPYVRDMRF